VVVWLSLLSTIHVAVPRPIIHWKESLGELVDVRRGTIPPKLPVWRNAHVIERDEHNIPRHGSDSYRR
jgi:hypothetical protein